MSDQDGQSKSPIEDSVRALFRQGGYAEAVPVIKTHIAGQPEDIGAYEQRRKRLNGVLKFVLMFFIRIK